MKAGVISLGCAKNLVDTENMLGLLQKGGIELTKEPGDADILIVNTCAFIETAKKESITTVLNMAEYKTSGKCRSLIVAGCLGQRYGQTLLDEMPEAQSWYKARFKVDYKFHRLYGQKGPVLQVENLEKTSAPEEEVATFF